ncbi:MAG: hypothetical protein JSW51_09080 [Gemmatimonadota bacterium]|nr:MAG: hypothetical protein JSW51_09080 [Gemmatimonadota bacterium]
MTTGVCFFREKSWEQDQWSYLFSNFGVSDIWEMGYDGLTDFDIYQPTIKIETAAELPTDRPLVLLAPKEGMYIQGTESLDGFVHPENAIYLFGPSHQYLNDDDHMGGRVPDHSVYIPLVKHEAFAHTAAYMTLWDRQVKNG